MRKILLMCWKNHGCVMKLITGMRKSVIIFVAHLDKVPYMIIVGQNEVDVSERSVRSRDRSDVRSMLISQLLKT